MADQFQDTGFNYQPETVWMYANEEYEPNPDEEDVEEKVLTPLELCNNAFVLRNYCTNRQAMEDYARYKKELEEDAKLKGPEEPKPVEWVADNLYGSVVGPKGPVGPNPLEVDPSLSQRDKAPIVLTAEEEYYYGPMEPASPPPVPKPGPPEILCPSELKVNDGQLPNSTQPMAAMSLNGSPLRSHGGVALPTLSSMEDWDGHPMEDPAIMHFYEEDFRLIPGDVIIFTKPRLQENRSNQPPTLRCLVSIYEDRHYFEDHGQFRHNFLDKYPLEEGDIVVRFGNFNQYWLWNRHSSINFYMYWPGLRPPLGSDKKILHPWYWIEHGLLQYGGPSGPTLPITKPLAEPNMPIGTKVPNFQLRNGDVLMHHDRTSLNHAPPFDHKLKCTVWNPLLESIGQDRFVSAQDRVLRHGMDFQFYGRRTDGMCATAAHAELYFCDDERNWRFLGRWTSQFSDHIKREPTIQPLGLVPLAGDVVFDRSIKGRQTDGWDDEVNIGGLVSFHAWENFKDYGREARPYIWFKDGTKYGLGNVTMVLRMGSFDDDSEDWIWHEGRYVELFILNTRGSSWRLNSSERWPACLPRNKPNYGWKPYNPYNIQEVSPNFGPQPGDVIVRLSAEDYYRRQRKESPVYVGSSFNPHYQVKVQMGIYGPHLQVKKGDFIIRAGYERNQVNPSWTNATVEIYFYEEINGMLTWTFKGRDMYIFGTKYDKGGLQGVQKSGFGDYRVSDIPNINSNPHRPQFGVRR